MVGKISKMVGNNKLIPLIPLIPLIKTSTLRENLVREKCINGINGIKRLKIGVFYG